MKAVIHQSIKVLEFLIRNKANLEDIDTKGQTALHIAVEFSGESTQCIKALLDANADKEASTRIYGETPLAMACRLGKEEAAKLLIAYKAIVESATGEITPLMLVSLHGNYKIVKALIASDADVCARDTRGWTALHYAALGGSDDCMNILVASGADKDLVTTYGLNPLCITAMHGRYHALSFLIHKNG